MSFNEFLLFSIFDMIALGLNIEIKSLIKALSHDNCVSETNRLQHAIASCSYIATVHTVVMYFPIDKNNFVAQMYVERFFIIYNNKYHFNQLSFVFVIFAGEGFHIVSERSYASSSKRILQAIAAWPNQLPIYLMIQHLSKCAIIHLNLQHPNWLMYQSYKEI